MLLVFCRVFLNHGKMKDAPLVDLHHHKAAFILVHVHEVTMRAANQTTDCCCYLGNSHVVEVRNTLVVWTEGFSKSVETLATSIALLPMRSSIGVDQRQLLLLEAVDASLRRCSQDVVCELRKQKQNLSDAFGFGVVFLPGESDLALGGCPRISFRFMSPPLVFACEVAGSAIQCLRNGLHQFAIKIHAMAVFDGNSNDKSLLLSTCKDDLNDLVALIPKDAGGSFDQAMMTVD
jgi:hypothetical protein